MPESWVRGAILIRMNSLIRGHSGVRWELIERMSALLRENIIPLVPLRGSISASGGQYRDSHCHGHPNSPAWPVDLSPLSYIAGTLIGNPSIRVFDGPSTFRGRRLCGRWTLVCACAIVGRCSTTGRRPAGANLRGTGICMHCR